MPRRCALCDRPAAPLVSVGRLRVLECRTCRLAFQEEFPAEPLAPYENPDYYAAWWGKDRDTRERHVREVKDLTGRWVIDRLRPFLARGARVLEIGCAYGYFLKQLKESGYVPSGVECSAAADEAARDGWDVRRASFESVHFAPESFDAVVLLDVIEHVERPLETLAGIRRILKNRGLVAMITPDYRSWPARVLGRGWMHYKEEHLYYYSRTSLAALLGRSGFETAELLPAMKGTSLTYMSACSQRYGNAPAFFNAVMRSLPLARSKMLLPSGLFAAAVKSR